ncbi:hypothetical protein AGMMS50256_10110 [Betaproteobacteria bacterium]|nr:hypothetical protein AGMMS50256_10110 [Betaproteobacteria bacterium]
MMQTCFPLSHSRRSRHSLREMKPLKSVNKGFSLIEVMVAMVIGLIALLVIMQVAGFAEGQKRTTTGAGDAQNNAALGIYSVERDIKQAGFGFNSTSILGCPVNIHVAAATVRPLGSLAPITINPAEVPAGDPNTDSLLLVYGSSAGSPQGDIIMGLRSADEIEINSIDDFSFRVGEFVIAAPLEAADNCGRTGGAALVMAPITEKPADNMTITVPGLNARAGDVLFNFGSTPKVVGYAIRQGNLTTCDYMQRTCVNHDDGTIVAEDWIVLVNDIVSLRAEYGRDAVAPFEGIDTWDQTTPALAMFTNQARFACGLARVSGVRLVLVARNSKPEACNRNDPAYPANCVTPDPPVWAGSINHPIDLSQIIGGEDDNWHSYRYQVFETVIPLRNIPWMGAC